MPHRPRRQLTRALPCPWSCLPRPFPRSCALGHRVLSGAARRSHHCERRDPYHLAASSHCLLYAVSGTVARSGSRPSQRAPGRGLGEFSLRQEAARGRSPVTRRSARPRPGMAATSGTHRIPRNRKAGGGSSGIGTRVLALRGSWPGLLMPRSPAIGSSPQPNRGRPPPVWPGQVSDSLTHWVHRASPWVAG